MHQIHSHVLGRKCKSGGRGAKSAANTSSSICVATLATRMWCLALGTVRGETKLANVFHVFVELNCRHVGSRATSMVIRLGFAAGQKRVNTLKQSINRRPAWEPHHNRNHTNCTLPIYLTTNHPFPHPEKASPPPFHTRSKKNLAKKPSQPSSEPIRSPPSSGQLFKKKTPFRP